MLGSLGEWVCQWFTAIGGLGRPSLLALEPRLVGWGGGFRVLAVRQETRSSGQGRGSRTTPAEPPPDVAENNSMTIPHGYHWEGRVPPLRLVTPPGYKVNPIPKRSLVTVS